MTTLKPVDFNAVSAKGAYVYCYLREDGSPYYIGIATSPYRPMQKTHSCRVPEGDQLWRIRVMQSGLTWEEAQRWERFYIFKFGRKDINTGILRNLTDGGEGVSGRKLPQKTIDLIAKKSKTTQLQKANRFGLDVDTWGELSVAQRAAVRYFCTAHPEIDGVAYLKGDYVHSHSTEEGRASQLGRNKLAMAAKEEAACKKYNCTSAFWQALTGPQKSLASSRFSRGKRNLDCFAGMIAA